jgi:multidrug resistance efflux pump
LGMARTRFELLKNLLGERFKPTELTFSRYFVAGEQTYLAVLDNLDSIASRLQSVSAIDERHATARIAAIGRQKKIAPADEEEIEALKARLALREAQLDRVNTLLTFNENAITEFDRVNNAVAEVKGTRAQASVDLETAIAELEALAARARKLAA